MSESLKRYDPYIKSYYDSGDVIMKETSGGDWVRVEDAYELAGYKFNPKTGEWEKPS